MDIKEYSIALDPNIEDRVLELMQTLKTVNASNQGGWQGVIEHHDLPWVEELRNTIETITVKTTRRFWFNVNGPGHYNVWHRHFNDCHAAVLYIKVPENSGSIEFRQGDELAQISPKPGMLLVFPGTLEHRVLPNLSDDVRISLATNIV
jgi:hypothetical protein